MVLFANQKIYHPTENVFKQANISYKIFDYIGNALKRHQLFLKKLVHENEKRFQKEHEKLKKNHAKKGETSDIVTFLISLFNNELFKDDTY